MKIKALRDVPSLQEKTKYAHKYDAGIDLVSAVNGTVPQGRWGLFPTGIAIELPAACFGMILPRSGLSKYRGLSILGGVIDPGYSGEIIINLANYGSSGSFHVNQGDRIAQLVVIPYLKVSLDWVGWDEPLTLTDRGENGHGSTGS